MSFGGSTGRGVVPLCTGCQCPCLPTTDTLQLLPIGPRLTEGCWKGRKEEKTLVTDFHGIGVVCVPWSSGSWTFWGGTRWMATGKPGCPGCMLAPTPVSLIPRQLALANTHHHLHQPFLIYFVIKNCSIYFFYLFHVLYKKSL